MLHHFQIFAAIPSSNSRRKKTAESCWVPLSGLTGGLSPVAGEIFPRYRSLPGFCRWWCAILLDAWTRPWLSWLRGEKDWKRGESQMLISCWFHVSLLHFDCGTDHPRSWDPGMRAVPWFWCVNFYLDIFQRRLEPLKLDWVELGRQAHIVPPVLLFCTKICRCQGCLEKSSAPPWSKAWSIAWRPTTSPFAWRSILMDASMRRSSVLFCWFEQCSKPPLMSVD